MTKIGLGGPSSGVSDVPYSKLDQPVNEEFDDYDEDEVALEDLGTAPLHIPAEVSLRASDRFFGDKYAT
jgi:hypothetical protein